MKMVKWFFGVKIKKMNRIKEWSHQDVNFFVTSSDVYLCNKKYKLCCETIVGMPNIIKSFDKSFDAYNYSFKWYNDLYNKKE